MLVYCILWDGIFSDGHGQLQRVSYCVGGGLPLLFFSFVLVLSFCMGQANNLLLTDLIDLGCRRTGGARHT